MRLRIRLQLSSAALAAGGRGEPALHLPCALGACHAAMQCHHRCGADRGHAELPVALRAAAGAALSRLSHRHVARAVRRCRSQAAGAARDHCSRLLVVRARLLHRVRRARRQRQRHRRGGARLFGGLAIVAGIGIIVMGLHFLGIDADRLADAREAARGRQAGRTMGRLPDGARLRARLDAVHRPDPRRHPCDRRIRSDGRQGRRHARDLLAWPRRAVHRSRRSRSSRSPLSWRASAPISAWSRRRWAACWC